MRNGRIRRCFADPIQVFVLIWAILRESNPSEPMCPLSSLKFQDILLSQWGHPLINREMESAICKMGSPPRMIIRRVFLSWGCSIGVSEFDLQRPQQPYSPKSHEPLLQIYFPTYATSWSWGKVPNQLPQQLKRQIYYYSPFHNLSILSHSISI